MIIKETDYLSLLKDELAEKYKETYPECSLKVTEWRQQEIIKFQNLMQDIVKGRISEKWFYTHLKPEINTKMPRIDTLNLLAEFLGYNNWTDYKNKKGQLKGSRSSIYERNGFIYKNRIVLSVLLLIMIATGIAYSTGIFNKSISYQFCFTDADTKEPIESSGIEVLLLHDDQSPKILNINKNACFKIETKVEKISFVVKAMYYKTDTITRYLNKNITNETIQLRQDDYALMIRVFSTSKISDWKKQRDRLNKMLADDVEIYQIDKKERGIEIYNKNEFIDKMTMPLSSLKNIEVIEVIYKEGKIAMMRFIQK